MNIREALNQGAALLQNQDSPFLDTSLLLAHCLGLSREKVLASYPDELDSGKAAEFFLLLEKRQKGTPVAYLTEKKEFYGREFYVDRRVLVPRPETECLVDVVLQYRKEFSSKDKPAALKVLDVCTGSGCIPITLALEAPEFSVSAADISPQAGEVFTINASRLGKPGLPFFLSDLLESVPGTWDIITANPPYLTAAEMAEKEKENWPEPELALHGGEDGLSLIFRLIRESRNRLAEGGLLIMEAAPPQMAAIKEYMERHGFCRIGLTQDLAGRDRIIRGNYYGT